MTTQPRSFADEVAATRAAIRTQAADDLLDLLLLAEEDATYEANTDIPGLRDAKMTE